MNYRILDIEKYHFKIRKHYFKLRNAIFKRGLERNRNITKNVLEFEVEKDGGIICCKKFFNKDYPFKRKQDKRISLEGSISTHFIAVRNNFEILRKFTKL